MMRALHHWSETDGLCTPLKELIDWKAITVSQKSGFLANKTADTLASFYGVLA
jgi:hypothetical protein